MPADIAPFATRSASDDPPAIELRWEESRAIRELRLVAAEASRLAEPGALAVEYWARYWPDERPSTEDTGALGWAPSDDWFNGEWRQADVALRAEGAGLLVATVRPLAERERPDLTGYNVPFRLTMKVRVVFAGPRPEVGEIRAFTDAEWTSERFTALFADEAAAADTTVEAYNGGVEVAAGAPPAELRLDVRCATVPQTEGPAGARAYYGVADRTIVTLRGPYGALSFQPDDVAARGALLVPDLGILVKRPSDTLTYEEAIARTEADGTTVYDRVPDMPEQSLGRALAAMPDPAPLYFILGCAGARQKFRINPNGDLMLQRNYIERIRGRDSERLKWDGTLLVDFGTPGERPKRELTDGYLPIITATWPVDGMTLTQTAFATPLERSILGERIQGDDTIVCMARFTVANTSAEPLRYELPVSLRADSGPESVQSRGHKPAAPMPAAASLYSKRDGADAYRLLLSPGSGAVEPRAAGACWVVDVAPGAEAWLDVKVPFITIESNAEIAALAAHDFAKDLEEARRYWTGRVAEGCEIATPEQHLNDFHKAHLTHMLITDDREPGADLVHTRVGSFHYGDFSNESCMIISDLDRRGYHDEARLRLESYLGYQGTVGLPGNYSSQDGIFYGSGGYECGGYNQHHGWVLWCMGEHYRYTRDDEWLRHAAPGIVKGCDWVIRERRATQQLDTEGRPVPEYGFLPAGSLEDVTDYHYWLSTNAFTYRGLMSCADALSSAGLPEGERLTREAADYGADLMRGFREALTRCSAVRLRDGAAVPHFPSRLYLRGRALGWIRETLEGAIHLIGCELLDPRSAESTWIVKDYEDNLYISDHYGYSLDDFEGQWFDRGGFSMQPNLLWGPVIYAMRDEVKHFLRGYFNSFASAFRPDVRMLTEHPLPALGDATGDHFKTSDEAQSTNWLRLMFLRESGDDLWIGQLIPRAWMGEGSRVGIRNAATWFGRASFELLSEPSRGRITMALDPPTRNAPTRLLVRFRHPEGKLLRRVLVAGEPCAEVYPERDLAIVPPLDKPTVIVAEY